MPILWQLTELAMDNTQQIADAVQKGLQLVSDAAYNRERLILYRFGNLVRPIIGSGFYFGFYGNICNEAKE